MFEPLSLFCYPAFLIGFTIDGKRGKLSLMLNPVPCSVFLECASDS